MVYDCKWAPDGLEFAATDSYGWVKGVNGGMRVERGEWGDGGEGG